MPGPRYTPRDFTEHPAAFGRAPELTWVVPEGLAARSKAGAAELQHRYVLRIRERMKVRDMSAKQYATASGMSYHRLSRLLRGEVILRLEDVAMADLILGEVSQAAQAASERERARDADERQRGETIAARALQAADRRRAVVAEADLKASGRYEHRTSSAESATVNPTHG